MKDPRWHIEEIHLIKVDIAVTEEFTLDKTIGVIKNAQVHGILIHVILIHKDQITTGAKTQIQGLIIEVRHLLGNHHPEVLEVVQVGLEEAQEGVRFRILKPIQEHIIPEVIETCQLKMLARKAGYPIAI
jgi:hypothetical protein